MLNFFRNEKYQDEKTIALRLLNKLNQQLESDTLSVDIRKRKEIIHKSIKYYYSL